MSIVERNKFLLHYFAASPDSPGAWLRRFDRNQEIDLIDNGSGAALLDSPLWHDFSVI
jgi:hypothetical protein